MRERLDIDTIRCESQIHKLANALAPVKGLNEVRVEFGASALVVDYDETAKSAMESAINSAGLKVAAREPVVVS
jgi:cation transport ATPase